MQKAGRLLVATVAESREPYRSEAELLFRSLRKLGGRMAGVQAVAYFVGSADADISESLASLDVEIKIVAPVDPRCPHANKLRMLDVAGDYDFLLALDTDIVVAGDFAVEIWGSSIAAKPVDDDPFAIEEWENLFRSFGIELPQARYVTSFALKETVPYFNSGVLLIPRPFVEPLRNLWSSYIQELLNSPILFRDGDKSGYYLDQIGLALALAAGRFPVRAFPLAMNFPTHCRIHRSHRPGRISPLLLHHHHRRAQDGTLSSCTHRLANQRIELINRVTAASTEAIAGSATWFRKT